MINLYAKEIRKSDCDARNIKKGNELELQPSSFPFLRCVYCAKNCPISLSAAMARVVISIDS